MGLTAVFVRRPTLVTVFLALVLLAGSVARLHARAAAVSEHRRPVDPSAVVSIPARRRRRCATRSCGRSRTNSPARPISITSRRRSSPGKRRSSPSSRSTPIRTTISCRCKAACRTRSTSCRTTSRRPRSRSTIRAKPSSSRSSLRSRSLGPGDLSSLDDQQDRPAARAGPGRLVRPGKRHGQRRRSRSASARSALVVGLHVDRHRQRRSRTTTSARRAASCTRPTARRTSTSAGDIQNVPTVAELLLGASGGANLVGLVPTPGRRRGGCSASATSPTSPTPTSRSASIAYSNGQPCVTLDIQKSAGTSEVETSKRVLAALPDLQRTYPERQLRRPRTFSRPTPSSSSPAFCGRWSKRSSSPAS